MNDILETEIRFYLVKHIEIYTLKKSEPDENYDQEDHEMEKRNREITQYYNGKARRFFPKTINDIFNIKNPYKDTENRNKIKCYYEIVAFFHEKGEVHGSCYFFKINEKTKEYISKNFNDFFVQNENQSKNWEDFVWEHYGKMPTTREGWSNLMQELGDIYLLIKDADEFYESESNLPC